MSLPGNNEDPPDTESQTSLIWKRFEKRKRDHNATIQINSTSENILKSYFDIELVEKTVITYARAI